ncbi:hypothetical protein Syun_019303 [Stephania yunnanensis]|uniref:Bet v I/Major latex protein domain-containing protein n=1 Tax=Stephania yunnanensis TaxID=152371 RepID=A0AAP0ITW0_9MAGN
MAQVEKLELACEVSCPIDKFYEFMKKDVAQLPHILPEYYKSCELLHGDGKSVGTIRLWKYTLGGSGVLVAKETIKSIDDINKTMTYSIFEGALKHMYKSFDIILEVVPMGNNGSLVKWHIVYEKEHEDHPHPHPYLELLNKIANTLDSHLHKA